jgi:hypothetical protein
MILPVVSPDLAGFSGDLLHIFCLTFAAKKAKI